jgi:hypothetical protein
MQMKKESPVINTLFLDIGGVLLTNPMAGTVMPGKERSNNLRLTLKKPKKDTTLLLIPMKWGRSI